MESYKYLIDNIYPKEKIILGALTTYMRYEGPREAIFTALCRQYFGQDYERTISYDLFYHSL